MSNTDESKILIFLSKTDAEILITAARKAEVQGKRQSAERDVVKLASDVQDSAARHAQLKTRQESEEERLRNEEKKIVERRKQLMALGGTKGAKLVEREIDIASRSLQSMEQRAIQAIEASELLAKKVEAMQEDLDRRQLQLETSLPEDTIQLDELEKRIVALTEKREAAIAGLDPRIKSLYLRVGSRYPGGAIAVASEGSCASCFRSLPAQLFNQVLSGHLLQCPGCSRILVTAPKESEEEEHKSA